MSVAFFIFAAAAAAQAPANNDLQPDPRAVGVMQKYGTCVAWSDPARVRKVLALNYLEPGYHEALVALTNSEKFCLEYGQLKFSPVLFAGAMAEALLEKDVKRSELPQRLAYDSARETIAARSSTEAMALCTVLKAPQATAALLQSEPMTSAESQALQPLGPVLMDCLKKDMKLALNKPALRSVLALAAYRIVTTPKKAATQ